jgi:hypothetical protein
MGGVYSAIIILIQFLLAASAHAQQECQQAAQQAGQKCGSAIGGLNGADAGRAAAGAGQMAGNPGMANMGSSNLCPKINQQKSDIDKAKGQCEQAKQQCKQACEQDKCQDEGGQKDKSHCGHNKPELCDQAVDPQEQALNNSGSPLPGQAGQSCDSGQQAKSQSPQMPQMPQMPQQSPSPGPSPMPAPNPTNLTKNLTCGQDGTQSYSQCNQTFEQQCKHSMGTSPCVGFIQRYCNSSGSSSPSSGSGGNDGFLNTVDGQTLTPGRVGEGVGTQFCNSATAYNFCTDPNSGQQDPSRSNCQTCRDYNAMNSPTCQANPTQCTGDPTGSSCPVTEPTIGASGVKSDGGTRATGLSTQSFGSPGSGSAEGKNANARAATSFFAQSINTGVNEGGGDGFNNAENVARRPASLGLFSLGRGRQVKKGPGTTVVEISNQFGPSIFTISTATYQRLCATNRLHHCGREN